MVISEPVGRLVLMHAIARLVRLIRDKINTSEQRVLPMKLRVDDEIVVHSCLLIASGMSSELQWRTKDEKLPLSR